MQSWDGVRLGLMALGYRRVLWVHVHCAADGLFRCGVPEVLFVSDLRTAVEGDNPGRRLHSAGASIHSRANRQGTVNQNPARASGRAANGEAATDPSSPRRENTPGNSDCLISRIEDSHSVLALDDAFWVRILM